VTIIAGKDDAKHLLSNGNFLGGGNYDEGRHFAAWFDHTPSRPTCSHWWRRSRLGRRQFTTMSGREVALKIYVEHGKEAARGYAMDALKRSMKWDEEMFGREYDLDIFQIVAVSDFNMGAMENKGLNVFNDKYVLADPEPRPTRITPISKPSSRMSISTTGPATASPAATGSSSA
jgi:aminopeptidase N